MLEYFPHITNASDDSKLIKIQIKYGLAGLGLFFRLLEELSKEETCILEYDIDVLIFRLRNLKDLNPDMLSDIIENSGLFITKDNHFFNKRLLEHKAKVDEKTEKLRNNKLGKTKQKSNENQMINNSFSNEKSIENQMKNNCEDIRLDKIKLNNINTSSSKNDDVEIEKSIDFENEKQKPEPKLVETEEVTQAELDFNAFWAVYPRKVSKDASKKSYLKARKNNTAEFILSALQEQIKTTWAGKELQFIPHASTWLNQKRFNDCPEDLSQKLPQSDDIDDFHIPTEPDPFEVEALMLGGA